MESPMALREVWHVAEAAGGGCGSKLGSIPQGVIWPWVKIQIVPPVNIPIPTIGSKMGCAHTPNGTIGVHPQPFWYMILSHSQDIVHEMIRGAVEVERGFICGALPCDLIGMNKEGISTRGPDNGGTFGSGPFWSPLKPV